MNEIRASHHEYRAKVRAIVKFGAAHPRMGERAGEFYQVVIDPNMTSPSGEFIRFGCYRNDEIQGWQRVDAMTICEVLGEATEQCTVEMQDDENAVVSIRTVDG